MRRQVDRFLYALLAGAVVAITPNVDAAPTYTFINIADSTGPYQTFFTPPTISPSGVIAFQVIHDANAARQVVRRNLDGTSTVVAAVGSGGFTSFGQVQTAVNDAGQVSFFGSRPVAAGGSGIFRADGSSLATIATGKPAQHGSNQQLSIDAAGRVTFDGRNDDDSIAVFVGDGVTLKNLGVGAGRGPSIGPGGTIVLRGSPHGAANGIYTTADDGASFQPIALVGQNGITGISISAPSVNATGTVAFVAQTSSNGNTAVYTGDANGIALIADNADGYQSFSTDTFTGPSINAAGDIAFFAERSFGTWGLYRGPDPVNDKIIESGDALFGSTLVEGGFPDPNDLSIGNAALASNGDVVFRYTLANGVQGIALAHPVPEPALLGAPAALLLARRRRPRVARGASPH